MYPIQPAKPAPAPTLGGLQQSFTFKMYRMMPNDQITIVEDLPRTKPLRTTHRISKAGRDYPISLIRVNQNGFDADLELMDGEVTDLAVACPKDMQNFRGATLVYDGRRWSYLGQDTPGAGLGLSPNVPLRDEVQDQQTKFLNMLCESIKATELIDAKVNMAILIKIAERITPGNALSLIDNAKAKGFIFEKDGVYKVTE